MFNEGPFCERDIGCSLEHAPSGGKYEYLAVPISTTGENSILTIILVKHQGRLTQQSIRPLQGNGKDAISKNLVQKHALLPYPEWRIELYEFCPTFIALKL